jgi:hypothetical protein
MLQPSLKIRTPIFYANWFLVKHVKNIIYIYIISGGRGTGGNKIVRWFYNKII